MGISFASSLCNPVNGMRASYANWQSISLLKGREFEALSYTWGNGQSFETITINDASVHIGANLETALRYIRSPDTPRTLWIDALCINQNNNAEKGHQVQKMCQVFSLATTVLAWLGPPDLDGMRAM
jgi:hypothetical protein